MADSLYSSAISILQQANMIVELANGSISPQADKILEKRGIIVVPNVLATKRIAQAYEATA